VRQRRLVRAQREKDREAGFFEGFRAGVQMAESRTVEALASLGIPGEDVRRLLSGLIIGRAHPRAPK
jgi:hypothetical protein